MSDKHSGGPRETLRIIVVAILLALVVRSVAYEPFDIPSGSMIPTLLVGDYLFVSKYSYGYSRYSFPLSLPWFKGRLFGQMPRRGDVVVFRLPTDPSIDYIKRVIGLPGDTIQMKDGILNIDGHPVIRRFVGDVTVRDSSGIPMVEHEYEETLPGGKVHPILEISDHEPLDNTPAYVVPPGHLFMMGDNRDDSEDSRVMNVVGFVPVENLVGEARTIFFSTNGKADLWQVWKWPQAIRWRRIFTSVE